MRSSPRPGERYDVGYGESYDVRYSGDSDVVFELAEVGRIPADLSESAQDYLEAIVEMESPDVPVRVAALARRLGASRPTGAMGAGSDTG